MVVHRRAPVGVSGAPVTLGIPVPAGVVTEDPLGPLALRGALGPVQAHVTEHWPDGSARWLLVDFLAGPGSTGSSTYTLSGPSRGSAGPASSATGIRLEVTEDALTLDTGALRARIDPTTGEAELRLPDLPGAEPTRLPLPSLTVAGRSPERPRRVTATVETAGPIRTEILLTGTYAGPLAFEARLAFFWRQATVRVRHTLINRGVVPDAPIGSLVVTLPIATIDGALRVDGSLRQVSKLDEQGRHVHQVDADTVAGTEKGRRADGLAHARGAIHNVTVVVPDFWQQYPKRLALARDGITLDLWAAGKDPLPLGIGAAKTHEYWIALHARAVAPSADHLYAQLTHPPVALAAPPWTVASRSLTGALDVTTPGAGDFLERLRHDLRRYHARARHERWDEGPPGPCASRTRERTRTGFYGLLNFGDWNFPGYRDDVKGCDAWGNLEYDLTQVIGLAWASTGRPDLFGDFTRAAVHYRDVDIIHAAPAHPNRVGLNHPHKVGHFDARAKATVDLGHTWLEGLLTHHRLTGERRSLAAAARMGDALAGRLGKASNARQFGWPMVALSAVATSTGESRYHAAALAFAREAMRRFEPTLEGVDWKIGILAEGLVTVHDLTGDAAVATWLRAYGAALLGAPPDEYRDPRFGLPLGYLAILTDDDPYRRAALALVESMTLGTWGKQLATRGRVGFRVLGPLAAPSARDRGAGS